MTKKQTILDYLKEQEEVTVEQAAEHLKEVGFPVRFVSKETARGILQQLSYYGNAVVTSPNTYAYRPKVNPMTYFAMNKAAKKSLSQIMEAVCRVFEVDKFEMLNDNRSLPLPDARKAYCYLTTKYAPEVKLVEVGRSINKNHSTIVVARKKANDYIRNEKDFRMKVYNCEELLDNVKLKRQEDEPYSLNDKEIGYYYNKPAELAKHYDLEQ